MASLDTKVDEEAEVETVRGIRMRSLRYMMKTTRKPVSSRRNDSIESKGRGQQAGPGQGGGPTIDWSRC